MLSDEHGELDSGEGYDAEAGEDAEDVDEGEDDGDNVKLCANS